MEHADCERMEDCLYWLKNRRETTPAEVKAIDDFMASVRATSLGALFRHVVRMEA